MAGAARSELRMVVGGAAAIGVCFGMARSGYGLRLPDMRASLRLSSGAPGAIAAGSYVSYLFATVAAGALAARTGPRAMVLAAGALAAAGMLVIARAHGAVGLAVGVLIAGGAAGLVFPPFSDVVARELPPQRRARAFACISSGTGAGVAVAAPVAIFAGASWRTAWVVFAGLAVVVALACAVVLPGRSAAASSARLEVPLRARWFTSPRSGPLLACALLVGMAASVWWTFAVDLVVTDGGVDRTTARVLQGLVGVASLVGALGGDLVGRVGARAAHRLLVLAFAAPLCALALAPGRLVVAAVAGLAFGATYNLLVAVQGLWSAEVFPERPSTGLAAVMTMSGVGLLAGPLLAGALGEVLTLRTTFAVASVLSLAALLVSPPRAGPPRSRARRRFRPGGGRRTAAG